MKRSDDAMRILLDLRVAAGGVARSGNLLAQGLLELEEAPEVVRFERAPGGLRRGLTAPYTPWGRRAAAGAARSASVDLVHNLSFEPVQADRPLVVTVNDVIPLEHPASMPNPLRRAAFRRLVSSTVRRAEAVLVPSTRTAAALIRHVGTPRGLLVTVPHAVDPIFRPATPDERTAARDRFAGGRRYVAAVGTARAHKNLALLTPVAAALYGRIGVETVLRGPAPPGFAGRAIGPLADQDLHVFYAGACAVLVCSHVEGFGYAAVEAAACGVPVVCGSGIGALELLDGSVAVVDVTDPGAVVEALIDLLEDSATDAGALGAAGVVATARLSPRAVAAVTFEVYREVTS